MNNMLFAVATALFTCANVCAQVIVINEGSNRNYSTLPDENGEYPDWIELYNPGPDTINLYQYGLSDRLNQPHKWELPNVSMAPNEYKIIYCSGKDRAPISSFKAVHNSGIFTPVIGWNEHVFTDSIYWDGVSNLLINTCSYNNAGYTVNSVFNQSSTSYFSSAFIANDYSDYSCGAPYGTRAKLRPNMRFNQVPIGNEMIQNTPYDYPAPYGNWYWSARHQFLVRADELTTAGLSPGYINSLAFDVVWTDSNTVYTYVNFNIKLTQDTALSIDFQQISAQINLHTNFKLSADGDTVFLFNPDQQLISSLYVNSRNLDNSNGCFPDSALNVVLFAPPTPGQTNNNAQTFLEYLLPPEIQTPAGLYNNIVTVNLANPNGGNSLLRYTLNGRDPDDSDPVFDGTPITIYYSSVLKVRAFAPGILPSKLAVASYLLGITHTTPILSVTTNQENLFGPQGIFDNWWTDWEKSAHVDYFDLQDTHRLIVSQAAAMQMDGGAGGSRSQAQHSFQINFAHSVLGDGSVEHAFIPTKPKHVTYDKIYLRNGSNQFLYYPYKDACAVEAMGQYTNNYYSGWRPVSVYINGNYFGLYELREKFDTELFQAQDNCDKDSLDILSLSYWYSGVLRAVEGSSDGFYDGLEQFKELDPADTAFWDKADRYFDMKYYHDYIIAEAWIGNRDWPGNNIKIYRSNKTDFRWRFCIQDFELALAPNGWTTAFDDPIRFILDVDPNNPYLNIWQRGMQNPRFRNYFINRFADLMNTAYQEDSLTRVEQRMYDQTVIEMPKLFTRWGNPNDIPGQMNIFNSNHLIYQSELTQRSQQVRNFIQNNLNLNAQVDVSLDVSPVHAGRITLNTITPGPLPWTGVYFDGNEISLTAIPEPGYEFLYWDTNAVLMTVDTHATIVVNVGSNTLFSAVFAPTGLLGRLAVSELNYHSDNTRNSEDWIEFYNYGNAPLDISGWRLTDGNPSNNYFFPQGTMILPQTRMVVAQDTVRFHEQYPQVPVWGPMGYGFSNNGEPVTLYNRFDETVLSMSYSNTLPWPPGADGFGPTLELRLDTLDPNLPDSWFPGCLGGSPGAAFTPCTEAIIFSEINYASALDANAEDWVELHNKSTGAIDLSNWIFKDSDDANQFLLKDATILQAGEFLVLYRDQDLFGLAFPTVSAKAGPFTFGLGATGDAVRLYDPIGRLYQSVYYGVQNPWPSEAVGAGYTLEIVDPNENLNLGSNWMIGCLQGSPAAPFTPCEVSNTFQPLDHATLKIFPNPSKGTFMLEANGLESNALSDLLVWSAQGILVHQQAGLRNTRKLDLGHLPQGLYLIQVRQGVRFWNGRLVIVP